ncbi:MAG: AAA family ATPase [Pseudomonadota bacterium]
MTDNAHPLAGIGLSVKNYKCFGPEGIQLTSFKPINIFIGRNNSGKSSIVDAINLCVTKGKAFNPNVHGRSEGAVQVAISQELDESGLRRVFRENTHGGGLPGPNHWHYGHQFVGQRITRTYGPDWKLVDYLGPELKGVSNAHIQGYEQQMAESAADHFQGLQVLSVAAERNVNPEKRNSERKIQPTGEGVTNLIRYFITNSEMPREEVEVELLRELNAIYKGDCEFSNIVCQEQGESDTWEIFLHESAKGDIRLSESGSSLKSIFIVLTLLRLTFYLENIDWTKAILSIEEPENNLHPALLRRLLDFVADRRAELGFTLCLTTHSPIAIDWSTRRSDSQVVHVRQSNGVSKATVALRYEDNCSVLDDLDIRASDILQANGVIWVEGPSDRLYVRRWIELHSEGTLREGTHYTIMYYGGKLLSHLSLTTPAEDSDLIKILSINRNSAVIIDSDRKRTNGGDRKPSQRLNATKTRIKTEVESLEGFVWITDGREIENYIPATTLAAVAGCEIQQLDPYEQVISRPELKDLKEDKIELASKVCDALDWDDAKSHLDLVPMVEKLCEYIGRWNHID